MKSYLMVFGGIFGTLLAGLVGIYLTPLFVALAAGAGFWYILAVFFLGLALLGLFGVPFYTTINYLEPENPLNGITSIIAIASGAVVVLASLLALIFAFGLLPFITILGGALVIVSGLLQGEFVEWFE